ncbi:MAG: tripartite tricarboxylate transporter substrate binding protein [Burkholderiaceae bacterium]|nr:tripartite tricarboxylate transporter substrate binding protein [Burkholderiaceae bacterium]
MKFNRRDIVKAAAALPLALSPLARAQQGFPSKPSKIILPFAPGGSTDAVGRKLAEGLGQLWGQPVICDNRPGASGIVATQALQKSAPDGYTAAIASFNHAVNPALFQKMPYDNVKDFVLISHLLNNQLMLFCHSDLPVRNVRELIAYGKQNQGKLNFASPGGGTSTQLAMALFNSMAGLEMVSVTYKGSGPAMMGVLANESQVAFDSILTVLPHVKSGRIRALAVGSRNRWSLMPDLPTVSESGLPGYESYSWVGLFAPLGTPAEIALKWQVDSARVLRSPAMATELVANGFETIASTSQEFAKFVQSEQIKWTEVVKRAGIKPQ